METANYIPILIIFIFATGLAFVLVLAPRLLGAHRPTAEKQMPYECGKDPIGSARERFSVKFYLVAMIFILFDIEAVFLIPWGVVFKDLAAQVSRWFVFTEMMIFIAVLLAGYVYAWKKGAFDWNK
jgi:NADH-quinone oxidoreductase subunit A